MRKKIFVFIILVIIFAELSLFTGCKIKDNQVTIAIPNDTTNEARALCFLEQQKLIKLKTDVGVTATIRDIKENPYNIKFSEIEAAQIPNVLKDVDYAVINSNYAIDANLNPAKDALETENINSDYGNILAVKSGNEKSAKIKALAAALKSRDVADFIEQKYEGSIISTVNELTDGYDKNIDYKALKGVRISVAASPTPHKEILEIVGRILAKKGITLDIKEYSDYILPNKVVESGEVDANYFQHKPYLDDFNEHNNTHIVSVLSVHLEPMCIYGGKKLSLDQIR